MSNDPGRPLPPHRSGGGMDYLSQTPAAPAPPERWSIREDLPEYDVVDEENSHLAFTSTVQAEAIAVRDALNAVARGSARRGAPEPSGEFHDAKFPWASSALLAYGRAEWACGKRHTREDHPEGRCPDVDAALGAVGGIEPAPEAPLPITAEQVSKANALLEHYAPTGPETTDVQVALAAAQLGPTVCQQRATRPRKLRVMKLTARLRCSSMSRPPSYCVECVAHRDGFGLYGAREREMIVLLVHHVVLGQVLTDRPSLRGRWRCGSTRVSRRAFRARLAAVVPMFTEVWTAHGWAPV